MNALVGLIQNIGIFIIAAQAVIHFAPEQKYEKYIKLVMGIMILLQFLSPLYRILGNEDLDWSVVLSNIEQGLKTEELLEEPSYVTAVTDSVMDSMSEEIKSRLNSALSGEDYRVIGVMVRLRTPDTLDTIRVTVQAYAGRTEVADAEGNEGKGIQEIEKVQIPKITIEDSGEVRANEIYEDGEEDTAAALKKRFCEILDMDESNMEVIVYGTTGKNDK